jgi:HCOMODA/2-hydroxy-3-carboxy-muconic semialdehyde decarboxylase
VVKDVPLRAVLHTSGFLGRGAPVFDLREIAGDGSNLVIQNNAFGAALAKTLGTQSVVLMRGHGFTVAAGGIREAGPSAPPASFRNVRAAAQQASRAQAALTISATCSAIASEAVKPGDSIP